MGKGVDFGFSGGSKEKGIVTGEKLIKLRLKDPQLPAGENIREKFLNLNGTVYEALTGAREAFNIPINVPIALLYKGRRMNPSQTLNEYGVTDNALLLIVPDQIKGGIIS